MNMRSFGTRPQGGWVFPSIGRILLSPDDDGGGIATEDPPVETKETETPKEQTKGPPSSEDAQRFIDNQGGAAEAVRTLMAENHKYRERARKAEAQVPEGAVVLKGDDAKMWRQFQELGQRPSDLKTLLDEGRAASAWKAQRIKEDRLAEVAKLHGWKPSVLQRLAAELEVEEGDHPSEKEDGKPVRCGFVIVKGDDGQEQDKRVLLDEYATQHWSDFLPALKEQEQGPKVPTRDDPRKPVEQVNTRPTVRF